ncbi:MAG: elongation factor P [Micavibrio aeruginosavorus]|uniref:Elongation factor P n=1 Tax=Micavibrio aeruginosavorus TaxID=349221 RepID=A0A2W4ZZ52_9BACT|nr:MAG: elongation factor P [Micavibrio aeruginosavorus]
MKVAAITLRKGHVLDRDGDGRLWVVTGYEIMQPGKGASVIQVEMRDVRSGNKDNIRYRTQETVERVRLEQAEFTYLYNDGDQTYTFMDKETFEQVEVKKDVIGDQAKWLQDGMEVTIESFETEALSVELPDNVIVTVEEAEPVVKGQTASSSYKPAIVTGGVKVLVPPFIDVGTRIVVKTEDGSYSERAKD